MKEISAFRKPQIHYHLYQRRPLDPECYEPAASSPQLYSCITSVSLLQQNVTAAVQLLQCACSSRRGPHKHLHTQAGCTTLSHFSEDYLSVKSRTGVLKAATVAVPATRSVRLPAVAKLFVISTGYQQFCGAWGSVGVIPFQPKLILVHTTVTGTCRRAYKTCKNWPLCSYVG